MFDSCKVEGGTDHDFNPYSPDSHTKLELCLEHLSYRHLNAYNSTVVVPILAFSSDKAVSYQIVFDSKTSGGIELARA